MSKLTKFVVGIVLALTVLIGLDQLSYKNDIFASSMAYCCNSGACDQAPCSSPSTIKLHRDSCVQDYVYDCYTCIDFLSEGSVCEYSGMDCCIDEYQQQYCAGR